MYIIISETFVLEEKQRSRERLHLQNRLEQRRSDLNTILRSEQTFVTLSQIHSQTNTDEYIESIGFNFQSHLYYM